MGSKTMVNMLALTLFAVDQALACLQAVQKGLDLGYWQVVIEGDAFSVIRKIQSVKEDRSEISPYITNIKSLRKRFIKCFKKISRNGNGVAHVVAREGLN